MTGPLEFCDLAPYAKPEELTAADHAWLELVQERVRPSDYVVSLSGRTLEDGDDFVVSRAYDAQWRAGRFIGHLVVDGRRMVIRPRLGLPVVEQWLNLALNLVMPPASSTAHESEAFIARLLARLWCHAVDIASRHGPPGLREAIRHEGPYVRGRLVIRGTTRLKQQGRLAIASTVAFKNLRNPIARALVGAERALDAELRRYGEWRTERVLDLLPHLRAAVGSAPRLPSDAELARVRYTPITLPYRRAVEMSIRIARRRGYAASSAGSDDGLLLDVAELWELYVLHCTRRAFRELAVEHGTTSRSRDFLLQSASDPRLRIGRVKPDIVVRLGGKTVAVIDAKYKRLAASGARPKGAAPEDIAQLALYLSRFDPGGTATGVLAYPPETQPGDVVLRGPWRTEAGQAVHFIPLPVEQAQTKTVLRSTIPASSR